VKQLDDITRLRYEYDDRKQRVAASDIYSWFNKGNLFALHQRQRAILAGLEKNGFTNLRELSILEMGCGSGGVLTEYLGFGALPENLYGIDLIFDRLLAARYILSGSRFANADGQSLPFPAQTFELVLQSTAISSILDLEIRRKVCADMLRVLKPDGLILSYDFWWNPTNKQTLGFCLSEIRSSFPGCRIEYQKITLAPPIARRLVPISWLLSAFLEKLTIFNTHYFVVIRPIANE
jgi:SAM-dependent methyltransferase